MNELSILIPFFSDNGPRENAFRWIKNFYENLFPQAEIIIATSQPPFNKAKAINNAVKKAKGNNLIIVDADIICSPSTIKKGIKMLDQHPWIIPYNIVNDLTKNSTSQLLQTKPAWPLSINLKTEPRGPKGFKPVGGINIMTRACFEAAGGFDERFQGWGGEDDAFAAAMNTFCGRYVRIEQSIYHLWHPRVHTRDHKNYAANLQLAKRYCAAQNNKEEMRKVINER
ncbi:hypothetical protein ABE29_11575 [Cytobacillus firmus]|uniref:galactosyltransferase-related protein n=1 Tax=Cytobacillus firmus TaxID=1399 RepID=UPI00077CC43E|nr:galactosyltransferase-related protein [Cytobacillus firmus]MBG9543395.1 hypothetical protein [Cytobacillus firmus]MBG9547783.1 hypothetical protein [Cytobacillus firmus]MBG9553833.1 hypothetical protein [Cytobacillus firmus]MBG9575831.1 hypothetical protein [Cytobacillus firmus]MBG9604472.1 hypothetical protein [Cytobacillus firmus]